MTSRSMAALLLLGLPAVGGCCAPASGTIGTVTLTCSTSHDGPPDRRLTPEERLDEQSVILRVHRPKPLEEVLSALIGEEWPGSQQAASVFPRRLEDGTGDVIVPPLRARHGSLRDALDAVADRAGLRWSFEDGELVFRRL